MLAEGPDEERTGFDLELLKTISNNVMRTFDLHAVDGRADAQVFTDILHRQMACFLTYTKNMQPFGSALYRLRVLSEEDLIDVQARCYHAVTTKIMKELPLLSDRLFKFLDINDDHYLSRSEFETVLSLVPQSSAHDGTSDWGYRALFAIMDVDESGTVVKEEVVEFFRALLTCLVDFAHMGVDIVKKAINSVFIPKTLQVTFNELDKNKDGEIVIAEMQGFLDELLHRDEGFRDVAIAFQYAFLGLDSDPDKAAESKEQLKKEGQILGEMLNRVGPQGLNRESFLDTMGQLADNTLNRLLTQSPSLISQTLPSRLEGAAKLLPELNHQFNRLVRSKKDEVLSAFFRVMDRNQDGIVTRQEIELAVRLVQPGTAEEKMEQLFQLFDINGDGAVTMNEASSILCSTVELIAEFAHIVIDVTIKLLNEDIVEDLIWAILVAYSDDDHDEGFEYEAFKTVCQHLQNDISKAGSNPLANVREYPDLFDMWQALSLEAGISHGKVEEWWTRIALQYTEVGRTYHNLNHLRDMFRLYKEIKSHLTDRLVVGLAVFFHEMVYDPQSPDNEHYSAEEFERFADEVQMCQDIRQQVLAIILNAHDIDGEQEETPPDMDHFMDLKLAVLARDAEEYDQYLANIRQEYTHLDTDTFLSSRAEVLQMLLEGQVYRTLLVADKYEERAKQNLKRELDSLAAYTTED